MQVDRLISAFGVVLTVESVLNHFELELPHRAYNAPTVHLSGKHLRNTFVHELIQPLGKLFLFERIGVFHISEQLR